MRALFAFPYTVRILVIHFILINSSIANANKYQNARNESNLETLARQQSPTHTEEISGGRIPSQNLSERSYRKDRVVEFGRKNAVHLNESAQTPSEHVKGVASRNTESHRRSKRCILAGLMHKKLMFAKHFFFPRPAPRPITRRPRTTRPPPPRTTRPPTTRRTTTRTTTAPRPETSVRRPPPPRHRPTRPPKTTTTAKQPPTTIETPSPSKATTEAPKLAVLTSSAPAPAHAPNVLELRESTTASIVPGCKFIAHPGVPVIGGKPKYDIRLAVVVEKIAVIRRPPGYFVWEFVHPKIKGCIELPVFGTGDTYVDPVSKKVFILFVDMRNTTLLIPKLSPPVEKSETCIYRFEKTLIFKAYWKRPGLGSSVVNGFPQHDVKTALWVWHTTKLIDSEGILVHRFPHPTEKYDVQIPAYGTDEYFESETSQVFLLFVDKKNRTLVIYKGVIDQMKIVRDQPKRQDEVRVIHKYREFGYKYGWGSIVIRGIPKYSLTEAEFVYETETIVDGEGFLAIQFEHPITGQRIQIPANGGDEYVMPSSSKSFIIFVDFAQRTLLIAKDVHRSKASKDCVNEININVDLAVMKYREIADKTNVGFTVIAGVPKYDIATSIFVNSTYKIIDSDNFLVIYFNHPTTGQGIQIPVDGGDEYILAKESKVYVIFVDRLDRTLLIFKGPHIKNQSKPPGEKSPGSIVIHGVPDYNESCVIFVNKTDKLVHSHKVPMIQFVHPITGQKIQIPADGGDEFLLPSTSEIFLIYVDSEARTLLIFKEKWKPKEREPENGSNCKNLLVTIHKYRQVARDREWGSMVIHGIPKYNKSCAIFVNKTERILDPDGCFVIQFVHPITEQKIQIPANGGDEYIVPSISKIFIIFVDTKGRTLLVHKPPPSALKPATTGGSKCPNVFYAIDKYRLLAREKNWGTMVVQGAPKYDTKSVIFVDKTNKMIDSEGCLMIQFVNPLTEQKIEIPYYGGDEFVEPSSSKIFVIFVDNDARTLFIFKDRYVPREPQSPNDRVDKCPNFNEFIKKYERTAREREWGSIVIHGVPKYNPSLVTFVHKTKVTLDSDGCLIIEFAHPVTKQEMHVPYNGGDEFVVPLESKIYVVFLDPEGRTLLIFKDKYPPDGSAPPDDKIVDEDKERPEEPDSIVNAGVNEYNISGAIFVDETQPAQDPDGFLLIHFVHPITGELIKIPFYGGVSYTPPFTTKVYIIFVDTKGRTLLVHESKLGKDIDPSNKDISFAIQKYRDLAKKYRWGSIVIRGLPKYDISPAILVNETENKIDSDGCLIIEFVHPITKQKILIPYHGGDEYVLPKTSKFYVIFVDAKERTLLILKKHSPSESEPEKNPDRIDKGISFAIEKYQKIAKKNEWGSIVIRRIPNYDISRAIIVNKTENKIDSDGCLIIEFAHPITKQKILIPYHGGDEYVPPGTPSVYVLFVDTKGRTLLIFKKEYPSSERKPKKYIGNWLEKQQLPAATDSNGDSEILKRWWNLSMEEGWGWLVVKGVPEYDLSRAIFVMKTEKVTDANGIDWIRFVHPVTDREIKVPCVGTDEYTLTRSSQVFLIFVDLQKRTLLILKADGKIAQDIGWGRLVVGGNPRYDLSRAIYVIERETTVDEKGAVMLHLVHPESREKVRMPFCGGDEYADPHKAKIFLIVVDSHGKTILIFKDMDEARWNDRNGAKLGSIMKNYDLMARANSWGGLVIGGMPKHNLSHAIIVMKTKTESGKNGMVMIRFEDPRNKRKMLVPFLGGDEYVDPRSFHIYVKFVDSKGQLLLIFKGIKNSAESPESLHFGDDRFGKQLELFVKEYEAIAQRNKWGTLVRNGQPKYDLEKAIIAGTTSRTWTSNGQSIITFVHPINGEKMYVPAFGGDEYVDPKTREIFVIFVDAQGLTCLIRKNNDPNDRPNNQAIEKIFGNEPAASSDGISLKVRPPLGPGSTLVNKNPRLDLANATYVSASSHNEDGQGKTMINFHHPITHEPIQIGANQGEEYYDPKRQKVFNVFVDRGGRTLLVPKPEGRNVPGSVGESQNININKNFNSNVFLPRR